MTQDQERASLDGYCIQVLIINGEAQDQLSSKSFYIENIGKGGFRFLSEACFELDDRVQVLLRFPDGNSQEVWGRICYVEPIEDGKSAYGFSVTKGFYKLKAVKKRS
ncbi:MAG: hypothetical protein COB77_02790 [Gammaproteobacteria bacterium]|nr:MAG: hypothetical protein COB77_02790 [Gammaproteobacteria bacterium]